MASVVLICDIMWILKMFHNEIKDVKISIDITVRYDVKL
jgi:hypothetical protein